MTTSWINLSYEGRALRRIFRRLYKKALTEEDTERLVKIANCLGQLTMHSSKLVEIIDIQRRVDEHDVILKAVPPHVIADAKLRMGV